MAALQIPRSLAIAALLVLTIAGAAGSGELPEWAREVKLTEIHDLATPNRVSETPLTDLASLQGFFVAQSGRIEAALALAGWPGHAADLFDAVARGQVEEAVFPVGGRLQWMMLRDHRSGKDEIHHHVEWRGKKPFAAFLIRIESADYRWAFIVPKVCANLSLFSRMGTEQLTVNLISGTAELRDPEGNPIVITAGGSETVSASWRPRPHSDESGTAKTPTSMQVLEGAVEFSEYGRPISLLVADGNTMNAVLEPDGSMSLAIPEDNPNPMPIKIGDAVGTISAGAGMAVAWPTPECRLSVVRAAECAPGESLLDASASTVSSGSIRTVELEVSGPDGASTFTHSGDLGAIPVTLERAGSYNIEATAISDKERRSTNSCRVEMELPPCVPPPPTCSIRVLTPEIQSFDELQFDASGSSSDGGTIETVVVGLYTESGKNRGLVEVKAPYTGSFAISRSGAYTVKAAAVDDFGQSSKNSCEASFRVRPRSGYSLWGFAGYGRQTPNNTTTENSGALAGVKASFDRQISRELEISLGAGADYDDATSDAELFTDLELNWIRDWGFLGGGFGIWDLTGDGTTASNMLVHAGWKLPWVVGKDSVHLYGEARLFLDELGDPGDNFVTLIGLRFRP